MELGLFEALGFVMSLGMLCFIVWILFRIGKESGFFENLAFLVGEKF